MNAHVMETEDIRKAKVQVKLDQLKAGVEKVKKAMIHVRRLNRGIERVLNDSAYRDCLGEEETRHYLNLSDELHLRTLSDWSASLDLVQECVHLRNNDESVTKVKFNGRNPPAQYGHLIGTSLRHNTHVNEIDLELTTLIGPDVDRMDENVAALREYIETSPVLRNIYIHSDTTSATKILAPKFLESIGANSSIEELSCYLESPPDTLLALLSTNSTIKTMFVGIGAWESYTPPEQTLLPRAIASGQSIIDLQLEACGEDFIMTNSIILGLTERQTPIQKLAVHGGLTSNSDAMPALTRFLENTATLQELEFDMYDFDTSNIECLLEGLRRHYNAESRAATLTKLAFRSCEFADEAAVKFIHFMRSPAPGGGAISLQELIMEFPDDEDVMPLTFAGELLGVGMGALMVNVVGATATRHIHPTMSSRLQLLSLHPFGYGAMPGFLAMVTSRSTELDLPRLHLSFLGNEDCAPLYRCLPFFFSLRELHLNKVQNSVHPRKILKIFRKCGGLRTAAVTDSSGKSPFLTESHSRILNAYLKRNELMWTMLSAKKTHWVRMECTQQRSCHRPRKKKRPRRSCTPISSLAAPDEHVLLLPTMLHVAKQVSITRVSTTLSALLAFEVIES